MYAEGSYLDTDSRPQTIGEESNAEMRKDVEDKGFGTLPPNKLTMKTWGKDATGVMKNQIKKFGSNLKNLDPAMSPWNRQPIPGPMNMPLAPGM